MKPFRTLSLLPVAAVLTAAMLVPRNQAAILDFKRLDIDFTNKADASAKATWSEPELLNFTEEGLGWDGDAASLRDGWIQTEPLAIGLSWRPAVGANIRVSIHPKPAEFTLANGQKSTPYPGDVFVRHSPDRKHWSSWQVLQRVDGQPTADNQEPGRWFSGTIQTPHVEREEYNRRVREYSRLDVPWTSDEEAAVKWLLGQEPDFFARHLPFAGYVQFRYEGGFYGGQRIKSFRADVSYGLSGLHQPPKDDAIYNERSSLPWRFDARDREDQ